jgi:hypothetical protein
MELTEEIIQQAFSFESTKSIWRNDFNSKEFKLCSKINKFLFDIELNKAVNCQCVDDFFFYIKRKFQNTTIKNIMEKEFRIKSGKVIQSLHFANPLSESSSDAECIKLLKLNKKYASQFAVLPKDWEKRIEGKNEAEKVEEVEIPAENEAEKVEEEKPLKKASKQKAEK